jgi:hypothetical protein
MEGYKFYFENCSTKNAKIILEATPEYLYQDLALRSLRKLPKIPKVIFILRKPSDRVYSLYKFAVNNMSMLHKSVSFSDYIDILKRNQSYFEGKDVLMNAIEHSIYVNYLAKWTDIYRENVCVFLFEDLIRDPREFMQKVSKVLAIDMNFYEIFDYQKKNATYLVRSQGLQKIKRKLVKSSLLKNINNSALAESIQCIQGLIKKCYIAINLKGTKKEKTEADQKTLKELDNEFGYYNRRLSRYFDFKLELWQEQDILYTD